MATTFPRSTDRPQTAGRAGRVLLVAAAVALVPGAFAHLVLRSASLEGLGRAADGRRFVQGEVVLVPGFRSGRRGRLGVVGRWRCRIAVRSTDPARARFLLTGGAPVLGRSEAAVMAEHLVRRFGVSGDRLSLEERSSTSWENVAYSLPLLAGAPVVRVASQPLHAARIRRYLALQAPALAVCLAPARDAVLIESLLLGPWQLLHEGLRRSHRR